MGSLETCFVPHELRLKFYTYTLLLCYNRSNKHRLSVLLPLALNLVCAAARPPPSSCLIGALRATRPSTPLPRHVMPKISPASTTASADASTCAPVVRSLDLGWGWAKYGRLSRSTNELVYESFPSLAPRHSGMDLSLSVIGQRNTTIVDVEGTLYEVGPDSADLDSNDSSRNLNDQYIHTEQYKAVFLGALHYIAEPVIDLLVVGLPLSNMASAGKLKELVVGTHRIRGEESVTVRDALVVPQPLGGLYYCLAEKEKLGLEFMDEETNLIIDPGFLTFDFLLAHGRRAVENRSGAHNGGVSKVLRAIAESLSTKFGIKYDNLGAIDAGLRRRKLKINGGVEELEAHIRNTRSTVEAAVNFMKNIVGDGSDIDNIVLLGGGAAVYRKTIESFFPRHKLVVLEDAQLANVRGFQLAGEAYLALRD